MCEVKSYNNHYLQKEVCLAGLGPELAPYNKLVLLHNSTILTIPAKLY